MDTKTIPGYPKYTINTDGTITSHCKKNPRVLKQFLVKDGYFIVSLYSEVDGKKKKKTHRIHRLLAQCFLPTWNPSLQVDHIDRDKLNNSLSNLRMVNAKTNQENKDSKGYRFLKNRNRKKPWQARIRIDGKQKSLGYFATEQEAHAAYVAAKRKHHGVVLDS